MRKVSLLILILMLPAALLAQAPPAPKTPPPASQAPPPAAPAAAPRPTTPAAPPATASKLADAATRVAVIDFQRAVVENAEGKKANDQLMAEVTKRQASFEKKQKALEDAQNKLRTQGKALSDAANADLTKQVDQLTTELNRDNEDAQKELGELQQRLLRPVAERASKVLNAYAAEMGFAVVFDVSNQANSIIYVEPVADITTEIIRRVDNDIAKSPKPPEPSKK